MAQPPDKNPASPPEFRGRVYDNITETIGDTPLVRLQRILPKEAWRASADILLGKLRILQSRSPRSRTASASP
jgi:cysteine synthase